MKKKMLALFMSLSVGLLVCGCSASKDGGKDEAGSQAAAGAAAAESEAQEPAGEETSETKGGGQAAYKLVMSSQLAAGDAFNTTVMPVIEEKLEEKTGGQVTIEHIMGATLAAADEQLEACSSGMCDISICTTALFQGQLPLTYMVEYPTYIKSATAGGYAMMRWLEEVQPAEYDNLGVTPLMITNSGSGGIITMNAPIQTMDDFKGQEIRGNAMMCDMVNAWGGTGVYVATNETYEAMRSGMVTGAVIGTAGVHTLALDDIGNYYTYLPVFNASFLIVMNNDTLNRLPGEWQTAVKEAFKEAFDETCWYYEPSAQDTYSTLESRGIEVNVLSDGDYAEMSEKASELAHAYAATLDEQGLEATAALDRLYELIEEANEEFPDSYCDWELENLK